MKLFLTLQFIAFLMLLTGWVREHNARYGYEHYDDGFLGGWKYFVNTRKRIDAINLSYFAGVISIAGFLYLIWSY